MKHKSLRQPQGFTLIEILIVIAIIGILVVIFIGSNTLTALKRGRDLGLRDRLTNAQKIFEQHYTFYGEYDKDFGEMLRQANEEALLSHPRIEPKQNADGTYCLCAELEITETGNSNADCDYVEGGDYYCVSSVQEDY